MALMGWLLGATVEEVSLFFGPNIIKFRYRGVNYRIGMIPMGGSVRFKGEQDKPKRTEEIRFAADMDTPGFTDLHPLKRVAIAAAGCVALVVLGAICMGTGASIRSLGRGFFQAIPFAPWTPAWVPGGRELADRFVALLLKRPFRVALGVLAVKVTAFNLLPLPTLNGGAIVTYLAFWRKRPPERFSTAFTFVGILVSLTLMGYRIIQLAGVLRRQL